jgi:XapX domain-containing protein
LKDYIAALAAGALVGVIYGLINVRSPAPPSVGLVGLLGILLGEQAVQLAKRLVASQPVTASWLREECQPHVFGRLPVGRASVLESEAKDVTCFDTTFETARWAPLEGGTASRHAPAVRAMAS